MKRKKLQEIAEDHDLKAAYGKPAMKFSEDETSKYEQRHLGKRH
jgi:hypothetical protein